MPGAQQPSVTLRGLVAFSLPPVFWGLNSAPFFEKVGAKVLVLSFSKELLQILAFFFRILRFYSFYWDHL